MNSDQVIVLDLGASKATCVCARLEEKSGFSVKAIAAVPCNALKRGVVVEAEEAAEAIRSVVDLVSNQGNCFPEELIVSVSGTHVEGMNVQGLKPIVPRGRSLTYQDVLEVINHSRSIVLPSDREQIQALPRSFKVDAIRDVQKPIGMPAGKLEVTTYLVTGANSAIQALNNAVTLAGFHIEQMIFSPLAAGIGVLNQDEMDLGSVVVDIGAGSTDVGIFANGSIVHGISLPVSSSNVTSDISQLLKTSWEEAERLKISETTAYSKGVDPKETVNVLQIGQSESRPLQKSVLAEIVEARMREIAKMVKEQILKSGLSGALPGGIILTGGGAKMAGMEKVFEEQLPNMKIRFAEPQLPSRLEQLSGSAVAVGLASFALQCFDELTPPTGSSAWKDRVKSLFSMINGR
jgi:cell division protein FtsA